VNFSDLFAKIPEVPPKNALRYFLAFNPLVPDFIADFSPVKGYELFRKLKKGDIVVDAGAYPGEYAVYASRKIGPTGRIICFEPTPENRKILEKIFHLGDYMIMHSEKPMLKDTLY